MSVVHRTRQQYQRRTKRAPHRRDIDLDLAVDVDVLASVASRLSRLEADSRTTSEPRGRRTGKEE
jgi:hypothetical protein